MFGPRVFYGTSFNFHSGSEHTIDGKRYDLEMHMLHYPKKAEQSIFAAALGIIFDTTDYDPSVTDAQRAAIDGFFDSLQLWETGTNEPDEVLFGELLDALDTENRWVYKGSLTTPPCDETVYWNVLAKVYPIQPRHLFLYRKRLWGSKDTDYYGNYRVTQPIDGHDLKLLVADPASDDSSSNENVNLLILVILAGVIAGLLYVIYN